MSGNIGLYLHIPFCAARCPYCDFHSGTVNDDATARYTAAVIDRMQEWAKRDLRADTLYIGGGTPTTLGAKQLCEIVEAAADLFGLDADSEITVEANPESADQALLRSLHTSGVNRISFGVQSLCDAELAALGRLHNARRAVQAIEDAHSAGIGNISADLMLGIPLQREESLAASARALLSLPLQHISAYMLSVEPETALHRAGVQTDGDVQARLYEVCAEIFTGGGFEHYEISNFARAGFPARHNLKYWRCEEYLGIGPSAHSFLGGERFYYPPDTEAFISGGETVSDGQGGDIAEQLMLRLRLSEGVDIQRLARDFFINAENLQKKAAHFERAGFLNISGGHIALTFQGFLLSNGIIAELIEAAEY